MPNINVRFVIYGLVLTTLAFVPAMTCAEPPKLPVPAVDQSAVGQRGYFYVGGKYVGEPGKEIMQGQSMSRCSRPRTEQTRSAGAYPWRRADRDQLDGNTAWPQGLGGVFRERTGLHRLHDRSTDARPLRLSSGDGGTRMFTAAND